MTPAKQRRILLTAQLYLQHTNQSDQPMRFDVAEVTPLRQRALDGTYYKGSVHGLMGLLRWENGRNRHLPLP